MLWHRGLTLYKQKINRNFYGNFGSSKLTFKLLANSIIIKTYSTNHFEDNNYKQYVEAKRDSFLQLVANRHELRLRLKKKITSYLPSTITKFLSPAIKKSFQFSNHNFFLINLSQNLNYIFLRSFRKPKLILSEKKKRKLLDQRLYKRRKYFLKKKPPRFKALFKKSFNKKSVFLSSKMDKKKIHQKTKYIEKKSKIKQNLKLNKKNLKKVNFRKRFSILINRQNKRNFKIKRLKNFKKFKILEEKNSKIKKFNSFSHKKKLNFNKKRFMEKKANNIKKKKYTKQTKHIKFKRNKKYNRRIKNRFSSLYYLHLQKNKKFIQKIIFYISGILKFFSIKTYVNNNLLNNNKLFFGNYYYYYLNFFFLLKFKFFKMTNLLRNYFKLTRSLTKRKKIFLSKKRYMRYPQKFFFSSSLYNQPLFIYNYFVNILTSKKKKLFLTNNLKNYQQYKKITEINFRYTNKIKKLKKKNIFKKKRYIINTYKNKYLVKSKNKTSKFSSFLINYQNSMKLYTLGFLNKTKIKLLKIKTKFNRDLKKKLQRKKMYYFRKNTFFLRRNYNEYIFQKSFKNWLHLTLFFQQIIFLISSFSLIQINNLIFNFYNFNKNISRLYNYVFLYFLKLFFLEFLNKFYLAFKIKQYLFHKLLFLKNDKININYMTTFDTNFWLIDSKNYQSHFDRHYFRLIGLNNDIPYLKISKIDQKENFFFSLLNKQKKKKNLEIAEKKNVITLNKINQSFSNKYNFQKRVIILLKKKIVLLKTKLTKNKLLNSSIMDRNSQSIVNYINSLKIGMKNYFNNLKNVLCQSILAKICNNIFNNVNNIGIKKLLQPLIDKSKTSLILKMNNKKIFFFNLKNQANNNLVLIKNKRIITNLKTFKKYKLIKKKKFNLFFNKIYFNNEKIFDTTNFIDYFKNKLERNVDFKNNLTSELKIEILIIKRNINTRNRLLTKKKRKNNNMHKIINNRKLVKRIIKNLKKTELKQERLLQKKVKQKIKRIKRLSIVKKKKLFKYVNKKKKKIQENVDRIISKIDRLLKLNNYKKQKIVKRSIQFFIKQKILKCKNRILNNNFKYSLLISRKHLRNKEYINKLDSFWKKKGLKKIKKRLIYRKKSKKKRLIYRKKRYNKKPIKLIVRRKKKRFSKLKELKLGYKKLEKKKYFYIYIKTHDQNFFATILNKRGKLLAKTSGGMFGNRGPYRSTKYAASKNMERLLRRYLRIKKRNKIEKLKKKNIFKKKKKKKTYAFRYKTITYKKKKKIMKRRIKEWKKRRILNRKFMGSTVIFLKNSVLKRQVKSAIAAIYRAKFNILRLYSYLKNPHNGCKTYNPRRL